MIVNPRPNDDEEIMALGEAFHGTEEFEERIQTLEEEIERCPEKRQIQPGYDYGYRSWAFSMAKVELESTHISIFLLR
jgi:hypothetical protein